MGCISHMELSGLTDTQAYPPEQGKKNTEVQLIQNSLANMKKAVVSWGKYVPWPVVRLLLRAGVEAELGVKPMDVTMFFSDIASFTTIVESLPPESTLILLSRYFTDIAKIIDDHGGIVLE